MLNNLMAYLMVRAEDLKDREEGQGMVEYALLAALISIVALLVITAVGLDIRDLFQTIRDALPGAN